MQEQKDKLTNITKTLNLGDPCGIYIYGSRLYGTNSETSDYDFVLVYDQFENGYEALKIGSDDIHIFSKSEFNKHLNDCDIMALESFFQAEPIKACNGIAFKLDLPTLRRRISSIVSNSWVKAKKKVLLEDEDNKIGYKSLFHSFRILDFGIQLAETGKIENYSSMNYILDSIYSMVSEGKSIEDIQNVLKPLHNEMATKFRLLAPKD